MVTSFVLSYILSLFHTSVYGMLKCELILNKVSSHLHLYHYFIFRSKVFEASLVFFLCSWCSFEEAQIPLIFVCIYIRLQCIFNMLNDRSVLINGYNTCKYFTCRKSMIFIIMGKLYIISQVYCKYKKEYGLYQILYSEVS